MTPFTHIEGIAAAIPRDNIDTDILIPSRDITTPSRLGFGEKLFAPWRFQAGTRSEDPDFILNRGPWRGSVILIAGRNFGCGSSREMAVWALAQFGIRCVIAPSFGAIFRNNCVRNGLLPIELPEPAVEVLTRAAETPESSPLVLTVDLRDCTIQGPDALRLRFALPEPDREMLLSGMDAIDKTWQQRAAIEAFEDADRHRRPWIWR